MINENFTIRHPLPGDAQAVQDLITACEVAEFGEADSSVEDLLDQWSGIDLNQDAWLAINPNTQPIGYACVFGDPSRFTFDFYTHPTLAPGGLANVLLAQCEGRALERLEASTQATATIYISHSSQEHRKILEERSYKAVKYHLRMQIDLDAPPPAPAWPEGITLRNAIPGQDDREIFSFIEAAFDRPGRIPLSFDKWRDLMMGVYNFDSELWYLAYHGDELIGAALCFDYTQYGWVRQLGVAGSWRRRGIGSALLQHVFGIFYRRGHTSIALGVESNNPNAYQLYESVGMKRTRQFVEYSKSLSRS